MAPHAGILIYKGTTPPAAFFSSTLAWLPWYGFGFSALLAPFAIYLFQLIAISAMVKDFFGISTNWKGRHV